MKKNVFTIITTVLVTLLIVVVSSTLVTSCSDLNEKENEIMGLKITHKPNKTGYLLGETLDLSGLVVNVIYEDGSRVDYYDYTTTPREGEILNQEGIQSVVVEKVIRENRKINRYERRQDRGIAEETVLFVWENIK